MAANTTVSQLGGGWDEAQCKAALARLEQLQNDLSNLRLNLPRVVEPFTTQPSSNAAMFQAYKKALVGSQNDIRSFRNQWHSQEIQSIFEHTAQSLKKDPDLKPSTSVPRYGWVDAQTKEKETAQRMDSRIKKSEDAFVQLTSEDLHQSILDFQKTFPSIKVLTKDNHQNLLFRFVSMGVELRIQVVIEREANGRHKLNAKCLGAVEPFLSLSRCISSRPQTEDFKYLLDMIAAYKTVKVLNCAKCSQLVDRAALTPTARRSRQIVGTSDNPETIWEAFHEGCLE